jgi:hypothetical protein
MAASASLAAARLQMRPKMPRIGIVPALFPETEKPRRMPRL